MKSTAHEKLIASRRHWRKTVGEYLLRGAGIGLALAALAVGVFYGIDAGEVLPDGEPATPYRIKRVAAPPARVLLVASELDAAAEGFAEAIRSYFGAAVTIAAAGEAQPGAVAEADHLVVYANSAAADFAELTAVVAAAVEQQRSVHWFGGGAAAVAPLLGLPAFEEQPPVRLPPNSILGYRDAAVDAVGLPFVPGYPAEVGAGVEVIASLRLHDALTRPAVLRTAKATWAAFDPFPRAGAPLALAVAIDLLADGLGRRAADPRVIFRLEDVNPLDYGGADSRFTRAAQQLLDAGVFPHVAITPVMVDAAGKLVADLGAAPAVVDFLRRHRSASAVVLHGKHHHRDDPRNAGKASGDAYEFFFDDDRTMGEAAAMRLARTRLQAGRRLLADAGLPALMFEAPHLEMSPAQERVARRLFPLMMHPPLFFGRQAEQFQVLLPWLTERDGTVYAPGDVGYVDALDARSVEAIADRLAQLASILPDPQVVVFFHPFMIDKPGREGDLQRLLEAIRALGYRPVSLLDQVEPADAATTAQR